MSEMVIDVDALDSLGGNLGNVADEFENANANSDQIADAVGHSRLHDTIRDFAHKWDDTRKKMSDAIRSLSDASKGLADGWRNVDQQGADALTGDGSGEDGP